MFSASGISNNSHRTSTFAYRFFSSHQECSSSLRIAMIDCTNWCIEFWRSALHERLDFVMLSLLLFSWVFVFSEARKKYSIEEQKVMNCKFREWESRNQTGCEKNKFAWKRTKDNTRERNDIPRLLSCTFLFAVQYRIECIISLQL